MEEAIYDLEKILCGDLYHDTEAVRKHRKVLKIGEFAEEQKTKSKGTPIPVDEQGRFIYPLKNGKDGNNE